MNDFILLFLIIVLPFSVFLCLAADDIAFFAHRHPVKPAAPAPTAPEMKWYDEPPFAKDGSTRPCWIAGEPFACAVYWSGHEWRAYFTGDSHVQRLNGRRVSPIVKPQEPNT